MIKENNIELIAIGKTSRETEQFVVDVIKNII